MTIRDSREQTQMARDTPNFGCFCVCSARKPKKGNQR
jgi:hypothetical protein